MKYTSVGESRGHTQAHTPSFSFSSLHSSTFLLQVKSFFICKKKKKNTAYLFFEPSNAHPGPQIQSAPVISHSSHRFTRSLTPLDTV